MENQIKKVNAYLKKTHIFSYKNEKVRQLIAIDGEIDDNFILSSLEDSNITCIEDTYHFLVDNMYLPLVSVQILSMEKGRTVKLNIENDTLIEYLEKLDNEEIIYYLDGKFYNVQNSKLLDTGENEAYIKKIGVYDGKRREKRN